LRVHDRNSTCQGSIAFAGEQALTGHVDGDQRGRAGRLHGDAGTAEVEGKRGAGGEEVAVVEQQRLHGADRLEAPALREDVGGHAHDVDDLGQIAVREPRAGERGEDVVARRAAAVLDVAAEPLVKPLQGVV